MSRYEENRNNGDFYPSKNKPVRKKPDHFEDISSDYTPAERQRYTRRTTPDFKVERQDSQAPGQRKFYDDSLLKRKIDPTQAEVRQQELEQRRRAREAQEAVKRQNNRQNDNYDVSGQAFGQRSDYYSDFSQDNYSGTAGYSHYGVSRDDRRKMDDTLEGIPLTSEYTGDRNPAPSRRGGGSGGQPPRRGGGDHDAFDPNADGGRRRKKKKKRHILRTVLIVILVLVLGGGGAAYAILRDTLSGLKQTETPDIDKLGISNAIDDKYGDQNIINIALFGVDTRDSDSMKGLSDSIIIVSANRSNGAVKMISILRDSLVPIDGHGKEKITHAYSYGGPELAIKTINQNFDMNIQDYATVNFAKMADIVDTLGGIDLEITPFELLYTNGIGNSTYNLKGKKEYEYLPAAGKVHMNGKQAVSYARIREDSDTNRAERQRTVLNQLVEKVKKTSILKYPSLLKNLLGYVETSMTYDEIMGFAPMVTKNITIQQTSMPDEALDNPKGGKDKNGIWIWQYNLKDAADRIHKFIYE